MNLAVRIEGVWSKLGESVRIGDFIYSRETLEGMDDEEREALGVVTYQAADAVPAGQRIVSSYLADYGGGLTEKYVLEPIPLEERKARKLGQLEVAYNSALAVGYPKTFEGVAETLQCRNDHDRTNWLGLIEKCRYATAQGAGDLPIDPPLRCTSNRQYAVTHVEAYAIMLEILNWVAGVMAVNWAYKDDIEAAATNAALDAINVELGWG